jgi:outer membrane protein assembly factor BamB
VLVDGVLYVGAAPTAACTPSTPRAAPGSGGSRAKARCAAAPRCKARRSCSARSAIASTSSIAPAAARCLRWETTGPVTSTPVFSGEHFIVGDRGSRLAARRPGQVEPAWSQPYWGSWIESSVVVHGGTGYVGSGDLFLVSAFDPGSGRNLWRTHVGGWVVQRPALSDDRVFVSVSGARRRAAHFLEQTSGLMALDRRDGRIVWHWPAPTLRVRSCSA